MPRVDTVDDINPALLRTRNIPSFPIDEGF